MATIKLEIHLDTDGEILDAMENALEGDLAEDLAPAAARYMRNEVADYLGVPIHCIRYDVTVLKHG